MRRGKGMKFFIVISLLILHSSLFCALQPPSRNRKKTKEKGWVALSVPLSPGFVNSFIFPVISHQKKASQFWLEVNDNISIACDRICTLQDRTPLAGGYPILQGETKKKIFNVLKCLLNLVPRSNDDLRNILSEGPVPYGSIWWASLQEVTEGKDNKIRPVLIVSNSAYNRNSSDVIVLKITSQPNLKFICKKVAIDLGRESSSYIECLSIHRIPKAKLLDRYKSPYSQGPQDVLGEVKNKLRELLTSEQYQ